MSIKWAFYCMAILMFTTTSMSKLHFCAKRVYLARAEQSDENGRKCWDNVKVPSCGGRCDSREIADWEFPFKKSHHPVCVHGVRKPVMVRLRHCDLGATPGTELFNFIAADDCRCKLCSSSDTSCEWLPPNSTLLDGIDDEVLYDDFNEQSPVRVEDTETMKLLF